MKGYRVVPVRRPVLAPLAIILMAAALILAVWPDPAPPRSFRVLCEAEGGLVVRTEAGPLCMWAGAVISVAVKEDR